MQIKQIMDPIVDGNRLPHWLRDNLELYSESAASTIQAGIRYDVIDDYDNKVGEISGDLLTSLLQSNYKNIDLCCILDKIQEGIVVLDCTGKIVYINEMYKKLIGLPANRILGKPLKEIDPDSLLLKTFYTGEPMQAQQQLVKRAAKTVTVSAWPIKNDGNVLGAFSVFRDITDVVTLNTILNQRSDMVKALQDELITLNGLGQEWFVGESPAYRKLILQALTVARADIPVMIRGENGTGKNVIAQLIHDNSPRKKHPMITVNCAAIPDTLIESELFGYEEGAFSGAKRGGKLGKFEIANGGTLFLDEIGDMPINMQAKLLRVLQSGEIEKLGRNKSISVDVRIIAATNKPLEEMIDTNKFRQDLFFRLNGISLRVPSLRELREDIRTYAEGFLKKYNQKYGTDMQLDKSAVDILYSYDWPGNVRELEHCIEACVVMYGHIQNKKMILGIDFPEYMWNQVKAEQLFERQESFEGTLAMAVERFERWMISRALERSGGDKEAAIHQLGISKSTFYRKCGNQK